MNAGRLPAITLNAGHGRVPNRKLRNFHETILLPGGKAPHSQSSAVLRTVLHRPTLNPLVASVHCDRATVCVHVMLMPVVNNDEIEFESARGR